MKVKYTYADGSSYEGEWNDGIKQGLGKQTYAGRSMNVNGINIHIGAILMNRSLNRMNIHIGWQTSTRSHLLLLAK